MNHKSYLQIIITGLIAGGFLTALAFSSNLVSTANAIPPQGLETVAASAPLTEENGAIINMPSLEGGVPLYDTLDISPLTAESTEPQPNALNPAGDLLDSSSSPLELGTPSKAPSYNTPDNSVKTDPNSASSHTTPSKPSVSSPSADSSSKEPSSSRPNSSSSTKPSEPSVPVSSKPSESSSNTSGNSGDTLKVSIGGVTTEMDAYSAICQIVEGEMGSSFSPEALKAQAVAAYSYIKYENKAGRSPSLPMRTPSQKVQSAVSSVIGQAVYYNGSIAFTPYHASSAGYTNSSAEVWGGSYSYLTNVSSAYDPSSGYKNVIATVPVTTVKNGLESFLGITLDENDPQGWMKITAVNQGGYVTKLTVTDANGQTYSTTGRKLRENILNYALKSHAFTFTCDGTNFIFTTNGYGHGVGMSQTGANGYAVNEGWNYKQILSHYYPGTSVY